VNWLIVNKTIKDFDTEDCLVLDQGLLQALWSLEYMIGSVPINALTKMIEATVSIPDTCLFVIVDANRFCLESRLRSRTFEHGQPIQLSTESDFYSMQRARDVFNRIERIGADLAGRRPDIELVHVQNENTNDIESTASTIYTHLQTLSNDI